jgi:hypothetical protein
MLNWLQIILIFTIFTRCTPAKHVETPSIPQAEQSPQMSPEQILFVFLKITRNTSFEGGAEVQLVKTQKSEGKLKSRARKGTETITEGTLICLFEDAEGKVLDREVIEDPLNKKTEHPGEKAGTMEWTTISTKEADFVLRVQYQSAMQTVTILKATNAEQTIPLTKIEIN